MLRAHHPRLTVISSNASSDLVAISPDVLERARLIALVTTEIDSQSTLARLGYGAFDSHPGPPSYPGWAPAHFALYERAEEFGATVHVMVERVDTGPRAPPRCSEVFRRDRPDRQRRRPSPCGCLDMDRPSSCPMLRRPGRRRKYPQQPDASLIPAR